MLLIGNREASLWRCIAAITLAAIAGCSTTSDMRSSESTAPPNVGTAQTPAITGNHRIVVTAEQIKSSSQGAMYRAAIASAKLLCEEFVVRDERYRTGQEATSQMMGIRGPWLEMRIQCADVSKEKVQGLGAIVVENESKNLPDASFFDTHAETFSSDFEKVFAATVRVLTNQGDPVYRANKEKGLIITGRARHGLLGFPTYEQYVIALDEETPTKTKVTFKLLIHYPNFRSGGGAPDMPTADRKSVYQRAAAFVDSLKAILGK